MHIRIDNFFFSFRILARGIATSLLLTLDYAQQLQPHKQELNVHGPNEGIGVGSNGQGRFDRGGAGGGRFLVLLMLLIRLMDLLRLMLHTSLARVMLLMHLIRLLRWNIKQ